MRHRFKDRDLEVHSNHEAIPYFEDHLRIHDIPERNSLTKVTDMKIHIAQIGTGRVGRPTAYTILSAGLVDEITVCDIKPQLAKAFAEELKHAAASLRLDVDVDDCDRDEEVAGADIILISAGMPRTPGTSMTRRDLTAANAKLVKDISVITSQTTPEPSMW